MWTRNFTPFYYGRTFGRLLSSPFLSLSVMYELLKVKDFLFPWGGFYQRAAELLLLGHGF
jgi:hypothetical protein